LIPGRETAVSSEILATQPTFTQCKYHQTGSEANVKSRSHTPQFSFFFYPQGHGILCTTQYIIITFMEIQQTWKIKKNGFDVIIIIRRKKNGSIL
jgi:hypothetical protein